VTWKRGTIQAEISVNSKGKGKEIPLHTLKDLSVPGF
jgi:hypothetical protein